MLAYCDEGRVYIMAVGSEGDLKMWLIADLSKVTWGLFCLWQSFNEILVHVLLVFSV